MFAFTVADSGARLKPGDVTRSRDNMAPPDCLNFSVNESEADKFEISNECKAFDFTVYTVVVGLMILFGVVGNTLSFIVMLNDSATSATSFLLQALAVADTLVLLAALPLYVLPNVYPFTGVLFSYYKLYMSIMPFLWPTYLIPYTGTIFLTVLVSVNRYEAVCRPFSTTKLCGNDKVKLHCITLRAGLARPDAEYIVRSVLHMQQLLSASLYFSKRGAYSDRLCRDVVGRWSLVGWLSRACTVAKRCILGYGTLIGNPTRGIQWYNFRPPGVTHNRGMGPREALFVKLL